MTAPMEGLERRQDRDGRVERLGPAPSVRRARRSASDCPSSSSIARNGSPSCSPISNIWQMCGWLTAAAARASRISRSRIWGSDEGRMVFIATRRRRHLVERLEHDTHSTASYLSDDAVVADRSAGVGRRDDRQGRGPPALGDQCTEYETSEPRPRRPATIATASDVPHGAASRRAHRGPPPPAGGRASRAARYVELLHTGECSPRAWCFRVARSSGAPKPDAPRVADRQTRHGRRPVIQRRRATALRAAAPWPTSRIRRAHRTSRSASHYRKQCDGRPRGRLRPRALPASAAAAPRSRREYAVE